MENLKIIIFSFITRLYLLFLPGIFNRVIKEKILAKPIEKLAEYITKKSEKYEKKFNIKILDSEGESNTNKLLSFLKIKNDKLEQIHKYFNYVINEIDYYFASKKEHKKGKI